MTILRDARPGTLSINGGDAPGLIGVGTGSAAVAGVLQHTFAVLPARRVRTPGRDRSAAGLLTARVCAALQPEPGTSSKLSATRMVTDTASPTRDPDLSSRAPLLPRVGLATSSFEIPTREGDAVSMWMSVEARGCLGPHAGCREHDLALSVERAAGALLTGQRRGGRNHRLSCIPVARAVPAGRSRRPAGSKSSRDGRRWLVLPSLDRLSVVVPAGCC